MNHAGLQGDFEIHFRTDGKAAAFGIHFAGDVEHAVADFFGGESTIREVGEEVIVGISFGELVAVGVLAGLLVGRGVHDHAMESFDLPSVLNKVGGKPVEQLWMRWLAAFAGALWLALHGALHIYEVSVGICTPEAFVADAPGVLGPPLLVFVALGIVFARQSVAVAGIPDRLFLKAVDQFSPGESAYVHEMASAPGHALEKLKHFMPITNHRHEASAELLAAARIGATLVEDCGPCAITAAQGALADGVNRELINRMLAGQVDGDIKTGFDFGQAIASQSEAAFELGDNLEQKFGRLVRLELSMAAATVRSYPGMKRGLGLTKACSLTPLEV